MDFTKVGQPSTKTVYVSEADKNAVGGQKILGGPYESATAKAYPGPSGS